MYQKSKHGKNLKTCKHMQKVKTMGGLLGSILELDQLGYRSKLFSQINGLCIFARQSEHFILDMQLLLSTMISKVCHYIIGNKH